MQLLLNPALPNTYFFFLFLSLGGGGEFIQDTVAAKFRRQLGQLMMTVSKTHSWYIRCIKPNALLSPSIFTRDLVACQLRSAGVLEAIRLALCWYPNRFSFEDFLKRFVSLF